MKIVLFLGAGASAPFGKPTTAQLKQKLLEKYQYHSEPKFLSSFLLCPLYNDIEHVLQALRDVRQFIDSYGGKYFSYASTGLFFNQGGLQIPYDTFVKDVMKIEETIENEVFENYAWDHSKDYIIQKFYDKIFQMLEKYSETIEVFTTNYDRAVEEYCSLDSNHYRCIDGFKSDRNSSRLLWTNGDFSYLDSDKNSVNVYLHKLHGSLAWKYHTKYKIERTTEERKSTDVNYTDSLLVYPTMSPKDGHEKEPYKTIRRIFVQQMEKADACIVIGFSFRDVHVNEIFRMFIENKKPFIIISPSSVENVCANLLEQEVPEYDKSKTTVMPTKYENLWCINHGIDKQDVEITMDLAWNLINSVREKNKK